MTDADIIIVTLEIEEPGKPLRRMTVTGPATMNEVMDLVEQVHIKAEDEYTRNTPAMGRS
jgi:hypothetical protein